MAAKASRWSRDHDGDDLPDVRHRDEPPRGEARLPERPARGVLRGSRAGRDDRGAVHLPQMRERRLAPRAADAGRVASRLDVALGRVLSRVAREVVAEAEPGELARGPDVRRGDDRIRAVHAADGDVDRAPPRGFAEGERRAAGGAELAHGARRQMRQWQWLTSRVVALTR